MINLIPPAAKHNLKKEYISRVATVWSWLGAFSIAVGVALLLPTLLFISLQYKALTADSNTAREMKESLVEAEALIEDTTILAKHLNQASESRSFLFYIKTLEEITPSGVSLSEFVVSENGDKAPSIALSGLASDRASLSSFVDAIENSGEFLEAKLPLDSLAATKNIRFNLTVTPTN